jgi:nicotinamidase-related amidase
MRLRPTRRDYFVLKPKHSGFFGTTLDALLERLRIRRLILSGIAGNICVLITAHDAYMRGLRLYVASDCVVSNTPAVNEAAMAQMRRVLKAVVKPSIALRFSPGERRKPRHPALPRPRR